MNNARYHLKCNVPKFEQHRGYDDEENARRIAVSDFFSLQSQFEARGYIVLTSYRNEPLRGTIQVRVDGFYYYVELYDEKGVKEI